jgi:hypothetical protein
VTDENLTFGTHRREACIDVVVRTCPASEDKIPESHGPFYEKLLQAITMIHRRHSAPALFGVPSKPNRVLRFRFGHACTLMIAVFGAACGDDNGTRPETLRFGPSGGVTIELATLLRSGL